MVIANNYMFMTHVYSGGYAINLVIMVLINHFDLLAFLSNHYKYKKVVVILDIHLFRIIYYFSW
ncbi:hypothetical protein KSS87_004899 [Heliosperma pusillum]|nr:hypothetical protein KSS87_005758 [Heliosperma pusillum]KAH9616931.1 hypothetical protein KSS87_004899 [Heliosperma pusillum]